MELSTEMLNYLHICPEGHRGGNIWVPKLGKDLDTTERLNWTELKLGKSWAFYESVESKA